MASIIIDSAKRQSLPSLVGGGGESASDEQNHGGSSSDGCSSDGNNYQTNPKINSFDGPRGKKHSDAEQFSGFSSPAESDSEVNFAENRLLHPDEYFQELDDLGSVVFQKSTVHFYTVSCKS
jgi:hypothetical protein